MSWFSRRVQIVQSPVKYKTSYNPKKNCPTVGNGARDRGLTTVEVDDPEDSEYATIGREPRIVPQQYSGSEDKIINLGEPESPASSSPKTPPRDHRGRRSKEAMGEEYRAADGPDSESPYPPPALVTKQSNRSFNQNGEGGGDFILAQTIGGPWPSSVKGRNSNSGLNAQQEAPNSPSVKSRNNNSGLNPAFEAAQPEPLRSPTPTPVGKVDGIKSSKNRSRKSSIVGDTSTAIPDGESSPRPETPAKVKSQRSSVVEGVQPAAVVAETVKVQTEVEAAKQPDGKKKKKGKKGKKP